MRRNSETYSKNSRDRFLHVFEYIVIIFSLPGFGQSYFLRTCQGVPEEFQCISLHLLWYSFELSSGTVLRGPVGIPGLLLGFLRVLRASKMPPSRLFLQSFCWYLWGFIFFWFCFPSQVGFQNRPKSTTNQSALLKKTTKQWQIIDQRINKRSTDNKSITRRFQEASKNLTTIGSLFERFCFRFGNQLGAMLVIFCRSKTAQEAAERPRMARHPSKKSQDALGRFQDASGPRLWWVRAWILMVVQHMREQFSDGFKKVVDSCIDFLNDFASILGTNLEPCWPPSSAQDGPRGF